MRNRMVLLAATLAASLAAHANSFVGNGGNSGDVELKVTLMQIRETFTAVQSHAGDGTELCTCNKMYERSGLCGPLQSLTDSQRAYCTKALYGQAPAILKLLADGDRVHVRWTETPIEVMESGQPRSSDAVANPKTGEIVVNEKRFRTMRPAERVFLLSHELMHFTSRDGHAMSDQGEVGPFKGEAGGRDLINAMAASASVIQGQFPRQVKSYRAKLYRSQASKNFWVSGDIGANMLDRDTDSNYGLKQYTRYGLGLRYQWSHFGVFVDYHQLYGSKNLLGAIRVTEQVDTVSLGGTYRVFFSDDPLSFWGQSHLVTHVAAMYLNSRYHTREDIAGAGVTIGDDDKGHTLGGSAGVDWYIPLFVGIWTYVGAQYEYHPYKLDNFDVNYNRNVISAYGGVAYGF